MTARAAYFRITTEDGFGAWVSADEVGTFYETAVHAKRGPGRPASGPPKPTPVVALLLRGGNKLYAKGETLDTIASKLRQALGQNPTWILDPDNDPSPLLRVPRPTNGHAPPISEVNYDEGLDA